MKLIHIQQRHKLNNSDNLDAYTFDTTVRSQFEAAKIIKKYSHYPLISEGLYDDFVDVNMFKEVIGSLKQIFPHGFPANFSDLTRVQKLELYTKGAAILLFFLGEIPIVYKCMSEDFSNMVNTELAKGNKTVLYEPREKEMMNWVKKTANKVFGNSKNGTVIVLCGRGHNFQKYCQEEGFDHESIDAVLPGFLNIKNESIEKLKKVINQLKATSILQNSASTNEQILNQQSVLTRIMIAKIDYEIDFLENRFLPNSGMVTENKLIQDMLSEYRKLLASVQGKYEHTASYKSDGAKNLLRFSIMNSNPHQELLIEAQQICKVSKSYDNFMKAIKDEDYSLALRKAAAVGSLPLIKIILKYEAVLNIGINTHSKSNGWTALDWIENAEDVGNDVRVEIISCLMECGARNGENTKESAIC